MFLKSVPGGNTDNREGMGNSRNISLDVEIISPIEEKLL